MGKRIFFIVVLLMLGFSGIRETYAQKKKIENLERFDRKKLHFGFSLAINSTDFIVQKEPDFSKYDSLLVIEAESQPGFNLGIIADYHITPVLNLRFIPSLSFAQRNLEYTYTVKNPTNGLKIQTITKPIESTFLEFPLQIKYRSARLNNFAAYVIGGVNYRIDLASQEDVASAFGQEIVKIVRYDFAYELGVGFDFFLEYFKFSPEIKLSFGLPNLIVKDGTMWSDPIRRLSSRIIVISMHFEG